jgi:hypothetical protein
MDATEIDGYGEGSQVPNGCLIVCGQSGSDVAEVCGDGTIRDCFQCQIPICRSHTEECKACHALFCPGCVHDHECKLTE